MIARSLYALSARLPCRLHHREGDGSHNLIGYHHSPAEVEARYGAQAELLEQVNRMIDRMQGDAA